MATHNLLLLPGDGIGPEVMAQAKRVIDFFNKKGPDTFKTEEALVGGIVSLVIREISAGRTEQLEQLLPDLVELTLAPYVGTEQAERLARL